MGGTPTDVCGRCRQPFELTATLGVLCDDCTDQLRANAAIDGQAIQAHTATLDDHRSPGERLRED